MADYQEEDLFDDLYDDEPASKPTPAAAPPKTEPDVKAEPQNAPPQEATQDAAPSWQEPAAGGVDTNMDGSAFNNGGNQSYDNDQNNNDDYGPINVKEDGKGFSGKPQSIVTGGFFNPSKLDDMAETDDPGMQEARWTPAWKCQGLVSRIEDLSGTCCIHSKIA